MKLSEIAQRLDCKLQGNGDIEISRVIGIEKARPGDLSFISNKKYFPYLKTTQASAVILSPEVPPVAMPTLRTSNPYLAFARAIEFFYQPPAPEEGIHPTAVIHPNAKISKGVNIGPNVVIRDGVEIGPGVSVHANCTIYPHARIGEDSVIHSNAVVREYVQIGRRCVIQNGAIIGGDGFGFAPAGDGTYYKIVQSGIVVLEDDVEVGAGTTIDRATVGETRIRAGAKLDNLVQIGHGCDVGENTVLAAQVGLAGSTTVGKNVMLAGQVGAAGHLRIGDRVIATAQTGIPHSVEDNQVISGYPAIDNTLWRKASVVFPKLPEIQKRIRELERIVEELKKKLG
ncbi:MAG TPA: UDP-3-O-(3-hydroxymyristoyl)glucosamine N-acyltransferase [Acidobacteriota bacterium]|jgi:UDP-3-O-[3-hydroxymyristoyl] glucosamine N-acyltransferase|nr:UDP-3-O-(3-hydroxymyristoyl)glucosamine N-acyltransferase [Acidobacteriota bacterium]